MRLPCPAARMTTDRLGGDELDDIGEGSWVEIEILVAIWDAR
jgi:hypothetical protein